MAAWWVSIENEAGDTPITTEAVARLVALSEHDVVVAMGARDRPSARMHLQAIDASAAEAIARRKWATMLLQAGVKVGPVAEVVVTADPTRSPG
jgi:hypothetical protein